MKHLGTSRFGWLWCRKVIKCCHAVMF